MRAFLWLFIVAVATLDVGFTAYCRECELNPVARGLLTIGGMSAVVVYRGLWIGLAVLASRTRTRLSAFVLPVWVGAHGILLVTLLEGIYESQK
jgi:hypothetical protein